MHPTGAGFVTRIDEEGIDEDIDIDGDDQAIFGVPQFTEGDVFPLNVPRQQANDEDVDVDIEDVDEETRAEPTLRHLVAAGKVVRRNVPSDSNEVAKHQMDQVMGVSEIDRLDLAVAAARQRGDKNGLVVALESKLQHLVCAHYCLRSNLILMPCCRKPQQSHPQHLSFVASALILIQSQQYRPAVGTHVVENAGSDVLVPLSSVPFANASLAQPTCAGCTFNNTIPLYIHAFFAFI